MRIDKDLGRDILSMMMTQAIRNFTYSNFGIYNKGGVRNILKKGLVTRYDVYKVYPWWQEGIYVVNVPGWYIKKVAENKAYSIYPINNIIDIVIDQYYSVAITEYHYIGGDGLKFKDYSVNSTYIGIPYAEAFITIYSNERNNNYQLLLSELNEIKDKYRDISIKVADLETQLIPERDENEQLLKEKTKLEEDILIASEYSIIYKVILIIETIIIILTAIYLFRLKKEVTGYTQSI